MPYDNPGKNTKKGDHSTGTGKPFSGGPGSDASTQAENDAMAKKCGNSADGAFSDQMSGGSKTGG